MTGFTLQWGRLIEDHRLACNQLGQRMALVARHARMSALQGELRPLVVVEDRRLPSLFRMTIGATCFSRAGIELPGMHILVAGLTRLGRTFELNLSLPGKRFMTSAASNGTVRPLQRKFSLVVVEAVHVRPGARAVAGFAAKRRSVRPAPLHPVLELSVMRIDVARGARAVRKSKGKDLVPPAREANLVAVRAGDRHVAAHKRIGRLLVTRDRERRAVKIGNGMAWLALILVRLRGKLPIVGIFVAIHARRKLHLVNRLLARRNVALRALHGDVHPLQRVFRSRVFLHAEK